MRSVLRGVSAALASFIALNLIGEWVRPPFETLSGWVTVPGPGWLRSAAAVAALGAFAVHAAVGHVKRPVLRWATTIPLGLVFGLAMCDAARFYALLFGGAITTVSWIPSSLVLSAVLLAIVVALVVPPPARAKHPRAKALIGAFAAVLAIPLLAMITYGPTRGSHRADVAVVLGARVWDDGTPSDALADRVDEAVRLYREGRVARLFMSGAVDDLNGQSEPRVMRARAVAAGVPPEAIAIDEAGINTAATVRNTAKLALEPGESRVLFVSHYYHQPRLKMLFDRSGVTAYSAPATMRRRLVKEPWFVLREVAAYYHSMLLE